jgi:hypothetical protein
MMKVFQMVMVVLTAQWISLNAASTVEVQSQHTVSRASTIKSRAIDALVISGDVACGVLLNEARSNPSLGVKVLCGSIAVAQMALRGRDTLKEHEGKSLTEKGYVLGKQFAAGATGYGLGWAGDKFNSGAAIREIVAVPIGSIWYILSGGNSANVRNLLVKKKLEMSSK